jgi:hypothetical protein
MGGLAAVRPRLKVESLKSARLRADRSVVPVGGHAI